MNEMADLWFVKVSGGRKSYASLITRPGEQEHTVNLAVSVCAELADVMVQ